MSKLRYYADQCTAIYGATYTRDYVQKAVAKTNQFYGGRDNLAVSKEVSYQIQYI